MKATRVAQYLLPAPVGKSSRKPRRFAVQRHDTENRAAYSFAEKGHFATEDRVALRMEEAAL